MTTPRSVHSMGWATYILVEFPEQNIVANESEENESVSGWAAFL
jgi:hypothetical protein